MFPVSDFSFVYAGLATVAATVGYAFARGGKHLSGVNDGAESSFNSGSESMDLDAPYSTSPSLSSEKGKAKQVLEPVRIFPVQKKEHTHPLTQDAPRRGSVSLKRKEPDDGFDDPSTTLEYPWNLANLYPKKRCKTPQDTPPRNIAPLPSPKLNYVTKEESTPDVVPSAPSTSPKEPAHPLVASDMKIASDVPVLGKPAVILESANTPAPEPPRTPSPISTTTPVPPLDESVPALPLVPKASTEAARASTPPREPAKAIPATPTGLPTAFTQPSTPFNQTSGSLFGTATPTRFSSSTPSVFGATAFGSSSKGFAAFAGSTSPFAVSSTSKPNSKTSAVFGSQNSWTQNFGSENSQDVETQQADGENDGDHAIVKAKGLEKGTSKDKVNHVTGEEAETVKEELKGLKLFVKRGDKPFASGIVGNIKLLKDKESGAERLLFRREPLWQVSMNVKLNGKVRSTYEKEENALRVVLKEPSSSSLDSSKTELVVYALKPGRACSKTDFKEFAEKFVEKMSAAETST